MKNTDMKTKHSIKSYFELLRPHQWIKNVLIFAAIIFSHNLLKIPMLLNSLTGFSIFCMVSSCVYIINDIADREKDRQHPKKCRRPIARGTVSVRNAVLLLMMLLCISFIGAFTLEYRFGFVISLYFIMNIAYSFRLKHMPILDIMCIAIGFVLRTVSGSFIIGTDVSPWMLMCVFLLAMFLALHKRCSEIEANGTATRKVLEMYSADMLHEMISAVDGAVIIVYSLYCFFTTDTLLMMLTIPFVVYGLFRYIFITYKFGDLAETPEAAIIRDRPLLINIALWGILCIVIMFSYGGGGKMNVYDFDDTIYDGDSSIDFWKYCLKRHKIRANYWFALLAASLGYVLGIYKKEKYKSVFFSFLMQLDNPEKEVKEFWKVHKHKMKAWYLAQYEAKDVVISASPDFLLKTICDELQIQLIASPVNPKSGQWQGTNCYGVEKVCRFREIFPNAAIVQFYSDSISDQPMAALAESAYIVKGERIIPWEAYKPKHFGCI